MNRKNRVISIIGVGVSVLALTAILLIPSISNLWLLLPEALLIVSLVGMIVAFRRAKNHDDEEEEEREPFPWMLFWAIALSILAAIVTVVVAILFGWWALIPACIFFGLLAWLVWTLKWIRVIFTILIALALMAAGLFCTFLMNGKVDTLEVDTLIVHGNEVIDGNQEVKGDQIVEKDQTVKGNQTVEKDQTVKGNQTVEKDQTVKGNQTVEGNVEVKGDVKVDGNVKVKGNVNVGGNINTNKSASSNPAPSNSTPSNPAPSNPAPSDPTPSDPTPSDPTPNNPTPDPVKPTIKAPASIRYGETIYVNLEGISASNLLVSNKAFVNVEKISDSRVAITLTEDVDGYLTITDSVSRVNVVIDIIAE